MTYKLMTDFPAEVLRGIVLNAPRVSGSPWDKITQDERDQFSALMAALEALLDAGHGINCLEGMMRAITSAMRDPQVFDNYPEDHHEPSAKCFHGEAV